jgi:7-carboxy-7-deazaguanine synthase
MAKFHYQEKFASFQGEGRYTGVPSIFLRMMGCNFRCKNFARYEQDILGVDTKLNPEVLKIIENIEQYKTHDDLPLVTTGCDSYPSVYPEFKRFAKKETADELVEGIVDLLPFKEWRDEHLVITGGEPLLGWQRSYPELLEHPKMKALKELTFETNGTQLLITDFIRYLGEWQAETWDREITFSVSPKLSCSGELREDAIKPDVILQYQDVGFTYLKFVVATEQDVQEALEVIEIYRSAGFRGSIYLMPCGGVEEVFNMNNQRVADLALKHGLRYSDRLHLNLYKNTWGT